MARANQTQEDGPLSEDKITQRYQATLARVLSTPPDHKTKAKSRASPKKRGKAGEKSRCVESV